MTENVKHRPAFPTPGRSSSEARWPRHAKSPARRAWLALLWLGALSASAPLGCSSECQGPDCVSCDEDACATDQRCVQNECRDACAEDSDCPAPQVCKGFRFNDGDEGDYCVVLPGSGGSGGSGGAGPLPGRFTPCADASECDEAHGFSCVNGECSYACRSHADCREVGHCDFVDTDVGRQSFCVRDEAPPAPGTLYTSCPDRIECADGYLCIGAGVGDLDAYCTTDCQDDAGCADGFYCGSITRLPCEDACDGRFQGVSADPECVPADQIGEGQPFQCGDFGLVRSVCLTREFCAPCETDADCLGVPNQVCARDAGGEKICTRLCDQGVGSCPWGNAATCGVFDEELGVPTCSHRFLSCHGSGKSCEPCRTNDDCGNGICTSSSFTGEQWCLSLDTRCECPGRVDATGTCSNGGCPDSPSGLTLLCIGEQSSGLFGYCYAANTTASPLSSSPQTGCWGPP